jgi:creatine kinase
VLATRQVVDGMDKLTRMEDALQGNPSTRSPEQHRAAFDTIMVEVGVAHENQTVYFNSNAPIYNGECPVVLPDLSMHKNMLTKTIEKEPDLYDYRDLETSLGVSFGRCIQTGFNDYGSPTSPGLVAGDEESLILFARVFDKIIDMGRETPWGNEARHVTLLDPQDYTFQLRNTVLDPKYTVSTRVRAARNLRGFRLPPACTAEERRNLEDIIARSIVEAGIIQAGEYKGDYYPLNSSESYAPKRDGENGGSLSMEQQHAMESSHMVFTEPRSPAMIASDYHRDWPDARGVYCNEDKDFFVWVNEKDHMRVFTTGDGGNIQDTFLRFCEAIQLVEGSLNEQSPSAPSQDFMYSERLGYATTCPSNLGTGMRVSVKMRLPLLSDRPDFQQLLMYLMLQSKVMGKDRGAFVIANYECLGRTEVELCNCVIDGADMLIKMEKLLESGEPIVSDFYAIKTAYERGDVYPEIPPFPEEVCPERIPDLVPHQTLLARALKMNPSCYHRYKRKETGLGVPFARCIKSGIDIRGLPGTKSCGLVAGDEECYDLFKVVFDAVIELRHDMDGYHRTMSHVTGCDPDLIRNVNLDPEGKFIHSTSLRTARNISGYRLPPSCNISERREVEKLAVQSMLKVGLKDPKYVGGYFPLTGSKSWKDKAGGMVEEEFEHLQKNHLVFGEPNSPHLIAGGFHRDWPDARGVFYNADQNFQAWLNQEDHVRFIANEMSSNVKDIFIRLYEGIDLMSEALIDMEKNFAHTKRLGYLTTSPSNLGTGLKVSVMMRLPLLSNRDDFVTIVHMLKLHPRMGTGDGEGMVEISNIDRLGRTEVELVNLVIHGLEKIIALEDSLQRDHKTNVNTLVREIRATHESDGVYDSSYFPNDACPVVLPDLSLHHNLFSQVMQETPDIYYDYREQATERGVTFGRCIKVGMITHGTSKTPGVVAGDEESYSKFSSIFYPVIERLHSPYHPDVDFILSDKHNTNLDPSSLLSVQVDTQDKHIVSTRVRAARNLNGFRLPPSCNIKERRKIEEFVVRALLSLQGQYKGDYYPLSGSESYESKHGGMTTRQEDDMKTTHMLFFEPDSPELIVSGYHRDWPDARGVFCNDSKDFFVWVNEKDHMRICTLSMGGDIQDAFLRFSETVQMVEKSLNAQNQHFMHSERLGYITTCPSNLGTGLRVSVMMRLPLLTGRDDFTSIIEMLRLNSRGGSAEGVVEISNLDRLGRTEVELSNVVIYGADQLAWMERRLEQGDEIDERTTMLEKEKKNTMTNFAYVASSYHANLTRGVASTFEPDPASLEENKKVSYRGDKALPTMQVPPEQYTKKVDVTSTAKKSKACSIM